MDAALRREASSQGEYLGGLYDIGFDRPEAHVVRKDGALYYAFFAKRFRGPVELRGLEPASYRVTDFVSGATSARWKARPPASTCASEKSLLLEAMPR